MKTLSEIKKIISDDKPSALVENKGGELIVDLLCFIENERTTLIDGKSSKQIIEALQLLEAVCNANPIDAVFPLYETHLNSLAMEEYHKGNFEISEIAFKLLSLSAKDSHTNNYAYVIRRGEVIDETKYSVSKILKLLKSGVRNKSGFSITNFALTLSMKCRDDDSWRLAYDLMKVISGYEIMSVSSWWEDIAQKGEIEGYLVHFFLLKHDKIDESSLGSLKSISYRILKKIPDIPKWLCEKIEFDDIDEIIDLIDTNEFDDIIYEYLNGMDNTRNSAEELLSFVDSYDVYYVYEKLLVDFRKHLSNKEIDDLIAKCKEKFSLPVPGEF